MTQYVALLRAVNVGGTGKLTMNALRTLCEAAKFTCVSTYIQSGNVVFQSSLSAANVTKQLAGALGLHMGKPVGVLVRTATEMATIAANNPFPEAAPNQVLVFFTPKIVAAADLRAVSIAGREEVRAIGREVYVHYPDGQGRSKLKLPMADTGTARNMNTVSKLLAMVQLLSE
ncbi:MAG: hypothetical protein RJA70_474 [Pseudomonadota bacterium]|jgi:uncharacterized protein (DUF1697 family)